eukprot:CAMPEP_0173415212 /NCGR_PEP_ID=MMETSP1356-20130122/84740_1 /TAXON_ID=77927 ORGANISM="Hemiselmis virescens, Strain PCC157" /NCGR_SAMPLE_ID=MMETSP1356 /ASSEMBLY_ACC=CAM_ASM_000847 /LENGTH=387 /DNA_ID=CAMNT_0014377447 /DNA_START=150 /DNA_END=1313 /DNA_ORIENTATION=+
MADLAFAGDNNKAMPMPPVPPNQGAYWGGIPHNHSQALSIEPSSIEEGSNKQKPSASRGIAYEKTGGAEHTHYDGDFPPVSDFFPAGREAFRGFGVLQIVNLVSFVLNAFIVNTSTLGWYGETNTELSRKYTTLITPKGTAFSIWGLIYITQGIFTIYQLLPSQRGTNNVFVNRIGWLWCAAQVFQIIWTIVFAQDAIWVSLVTMACIWTSLLLILVRLDPGRTNTLIGGSYMVEERYRVTPLGWFIYYLPFQLHFGWITAAFILNTNVTIVFEKASLEIMLGVAITCLGIAFASVTFWVATRRDMVHAFVLSWATNWISQYIIADAPLPWGTSNDELFVRGLSLSAGIFSVLCLIMGFLAMFLAWGSYFLERRRSAQHAAMFSARA